MIAEFKEKVLSGNSFYVCVCVCSILPFKVLVYFSAKTSQFLPISLSSTTSRLTQNIKHVCTTSFSLFYLSPSPRFVQGFSVVR